jgi:exodeoxyribonuclease VII small subunit
MEEKKISFEEAYTRLEAAAKAMSDDTISLEAAIENYKNGKEYYDTCIKILDDAKQLIAVYDKETDSVKEM